MLALSPRDDDDDDDDISNDALGNDNNENENTLEGCEVKVWWADDERYYQGVVQEYEALSGRHRVQYSESEWEFLLLGGEGYVLLAPADRIARWRRRLGRAAEQRDGQQGQQREQREQREAAAGQQEVDQHEQEVASSSSRKRARRSEL